MPVPVSAKRRGNVHTVRKQAGNDSGAMTDFRLRECYVDSATSEATIVFDLPSECLVTLKIYGDDGRELATLLEDIKFGSGTHQVTYRSDQEFYYRLVARPDGDVFAAVKRAKVRK